MMAKVTRMAAIRRQTGAGDSEVVGDAVMREFVRGYALVWRGHIRLASVRDDGCMRVAICLRRLQTAGQLDLHAWMLGRRYGE